MKDFLGFIYKFVSDKVIFKGKVYLLLFLTWGPILFITMEIMEHEEGRKLTHADNVNAAVYSFLIWVGLIIIREFWVFTRK